MGTVKNINLILLGTASKGFDMIDQPVGKKAVRKKGVVGSFNKQPAAVIAHVLDRFGIVGIFIHPFAHMRLEQIVKHLENVTNRSDGGIQHHLQKIRKRDGLAAGCPSGASIDMPHGLFDVFHRLPSPIPGWFSPDRVA